MRILGRTLGRICMQTYRIFNVYLWQTLIPQRYEKTITCMLDIADMRMLC